MQQKTHSLNENEKKFLLAILDEGNLTNIEISKRTGMNKSTCSRIRKRLEKDFISEYIPIIELDKVGIDIFVVLTFRWGSSNNKDLTKKFFYELKKDPRVIFLANGEGNMMTTVVFFGFGNIGEYHDYFKKLRGVYGKAIDNVNSLILPSKEIIKNDFTEMIKYMIRGRK